MGSYGLTGIAWAQRITHARSLCIFDICLSHVAHVKHTHCHTLVNTYPRSQPHTQSFCTALHGQPQAAPVPRERSPARLRVALPPHTPDVGPSGKTTRLLSNRQARAHRGARSLPRVGSRQDLPTARACRGAWGLGRGREAGRVDGWAVDTARVESVADHVVVPLRQVRRVVCRRRAVVQVILFFSESHCLFFSITSFFYSQS
jgi:hypothetical protein